jgi:plasmid stabilization system protein ParE
LKFLVELHPEAEAEVNEAAAFLDSESSGLGRIFLDDLKHAIEMIAAHPKIAPIIRGRVRQKRLRKFPYSFIYSVAGEKIHILAVSHQKRRPFYWRLRR